MGLSESSLTLITKPFYFYRIAKCHVTAHVVKVYVAKIAIAFQKQIRTHEYMSSDSDSENTDEQMFQTMKFIVLIYFLSIYYSLIFIRHLVAQPLSLVGLSRPSLLSQPGRTKITYGTYFY